MQTINVQTFFLIMVLVPLTSIISVTIMLSFISIFRCYSRFALFMRRKTFSEDVVEQNWELTKISQSNGYYRYKYWFYERISLLILCWIFGVPCNATMITNFRREKIVDTVTRRERHVNDHSEDVKMVQVERTTEKDMRDLRPSSKQMTTVRAKARMATFDHYSLFELEPVHCKCSLEIVDNMKSSINPLEYHSQTMLYDYCSRDSTVNLIVSEYGECLLGSILYYQHWAHEKRRQLNGHLSP